MKKNFMISIWMTIVTTVLLGIVYPFVVTGIAQVIFPHQANGDLIMANGKIVGSQPHRPAIFLARIFPLASLRSRHRLRRRQLRRLQPRPHE